MAGDFQRHAIALFDAGYRVVPIPRGGKRPVIEGWQEYGREQSKDDVADMVRRANGCGIGILARTTAGVDIDVREPELAERLTALAQEMLGWSPERIGEAPKRLLPYRVETPFSKIHTADFTLPGDQPGDKAHKVEVLADGQQWVALHIHPNTRRPYHWPDQSILETPREDLPELTEDKARAFVEAATNMIAAAGGKPHGGRAKVSKLSDRKSSRQGPAGTKEALESALEVYRNTDLGYDEWCAVAYAIKASIGEDGHSLWDDWSAQSNKNDQDETDKVWDAAKPMGRIGAGTIYHHARELGWKPPAKLALNPDKEKRKKANVAPARRAKPAPAPEHVDPETGEIVSDWRDLLQQSDKGAIKGNLFNVMVALRSAPELAGNIRWNEFRLQTDVVKALPWSDTIGRAWNNFDDVSLTEWLQANDIAVGLDVAQQAVDAIAAESRTHPLREWLGGLKWDGVSRAGKWLTYYLGAEPNDYVSHIGQCWLISAVARVFSPGCKADHVLVLEGPQGKGKSTALKTLTGAEWFTDELADLGSKDSAMQARGVWVVELSELDQLNRGEVSRIKAFITRTIDRFRPPYGRRVIEAPRECVFAGTVNNNQYLKDETGNRRFWPVEIQSIDIEGLTRDREQIWAEAVHLFRAGVPWWIADKAVQQCAEEEQARRQIIDPWLQKIAGYVRDGKPISTSTILGGLLEKRMGDWSRADEMRVASCLKLLGFERRRVTADDGERSWLYKKVSQP